jgi:hypothetical protein
MAFLFFRHTSITRKNFLDFLVDHMNIEKLKKALAPWLKIETWHTPHCSDRKRFNRSLKSAFDSLGTPIAFDDFMEAMTQLVDEHHPV